MHFVIFQVTASEKTKGVPCPEQKAKLVYEEGKAGGVGQMVFRIDSVLLPSFVTLSL